ncbi:MAG: glycerophosphodiester phosphodiesterase family protein [Planctomycetota bacterium]
MTSSSSGEPRPDYRLRAGLRQLARAERLGARVTSAEANGRARLARTGARTVLAAGQARAWTGAQLRRGVHAVQQWWQRLRTPAPAVSVPGPDAFLVVAHRGSSAVKIENTIEAMRYAIDVDHANAVEIDLSFTADGQVVLWHDWLPNDAVALARQLGLEPGQKYKPDAPDLWSSWRRPAHQLTLEELRTHYGYKKKAFLGFSRKVTAHIPTLREFLEWASGAAELRAVFMDIKLPEDQVALVPAFAKAIGDLLAEFQPEYEAIFMTPREAVLSALKQCPGDRAFSFDVEVPPGIVLNATEHSGTRTAIEHQNAYASVGRPALTWGAWRIYQEIIEHDVALRAKHNEAGAGPPVRRLIAWTLNNPAEYRRVLQLGVQGILTDKPRKLRRTAERLGVLPQRARHRASSLS